MGAYRPGVIAGYAFGDINGDGKDRANAEPRGNAVVDGSPELVVDVQLFNASGKVDETKTNAKGNYFFRDIVPGTYSIVVTSISSDRLLTTSRTIDGLVVTSGSVHLPNKRFGNFKDALIDPRLAIGTALKAKIEGTVFLDKNGDGNRDASELGMAGFTVQLEQRPAGVGTPQIAVTDARGVYSFEVDPRSQRGPGSYIVKLLDKDHYTAKSTQSPITGVRLNDIITTQASVAKNSDQTLKPIPLNFGVERFAALYVNVFNDLDADGIQDASEPLLNDTNPKVGGIFLDNQKPTLVGIRSSSTIWTMAPIHFASKITLA